MILPVLSGLLLALVNAQAGDVLATLAKLERQTWQLRADQNAVALAPLLPASYHELFPFEPGRRSGAEVLKDLADQSFSRHVLRRFQLETPTPGTALLTYDLDLAGSIRGRDLPPSRFTVSALWVRQAGRWQCAYRQGTARPAETAAATVTDLEIHLSEEPAARFQYRGAQTLEDVHLTLTLTFTDGDRVSFNRYWGEWRTDEIKKTELPLARFLGVVDRTPFVGGVERVDFTGRATRDGRPVELRRSVRHFIKQ
jgi:hypothetical protein